MFSIGVLSGVLGVLLLDSLGSLIMRGDTARYAALAPLSRVIWFLAAALAASPHHGEPALAIAIGAVGGTIVGFTDATAGWWISTALGATPMGSGHTWALRVSKVSTRVALRAGAVGAIGGLLASVI